MSEPGYPPFVKAHLPYIQRTMKKQIREQIAKRQEEEKFGNRKTVMNEEDVKLERKFKTVILVDDDVVSEYAFKWALVYSVAARDQLLIVHHEPNSTKRGEAFGLLNAFAAMAHKAGMMHTRTKLLSGRTSVVKAVKKCIQEEEPSLVVVASRGLGAIKRTFLGSVSDHTVHHSRCPVLVIHRDKQNTTNVVKSLHNPPHMVIAIDRTAESRRAFEWLVENALPSNVALTLLHVQRMQPYERHFQSDHDDANRFLDELIQSCRPKTQRQMKKHIGYGKAGPYIVEYTQKTSADLLVVATRGLGGVGRQLMGSVSDHLLHNMHAPVLVYKDNGTDCKARRAEQEALKRNLGSKDRVKGSYLNLNV